MRSCLLRGTVGCGVNNTHVSLIKQSYTNIKLKNTKKMFPKFSV